VPCDRGARWRSAWNKLNPPRPFFCKKFTHPVPKEHNSALEFGHPEAG
jgi:hypothetical protein